MSHYTAVAWAPFTVDLVLPLGGAARPVTGIPEGYWVRRAVHAGHAGVWRG